MGVLRVLGLVRIRLVLADSEHTLHVIYGHAAVAIDDQAALLAFGSFLS